MLVRSGSDFQDLVHASEGMDVRYKYIPGHAGDHGNEEADNFATPGIATEVAVGRQRGWAYLLQDVVW